MATKITRQRVCDLGERHGGDIRQWRITVDRESRVFDLCPTCSRPLSRLWNAGRTVPGGRMRIATLEEIEAAKKPPTSS